MNLWFMLFVIIFEIKEKMIRFFNFIKYWLFLFIMLMLFSALFYTCNKALELPHINDPILFEQDQGMG